VTQTSPQPAERVSSRQKRIEEQRRKIDAVRIQQRRRRLMWGGFIIVGVAIALALVLFFLPRPVPSSMRQVVTEPGNHVAEGDVASLVYHSRPPSSGVHYGTVPQAFEYRMYDQPLSPGRWVHMLEHGAVAVLYRTDLCDATCVGQLGTFYDNAPRSTLVGGIRHLVITPYQDMDHAIAVVAWGYVDEMDQMDPDRVMADFKSKVDATTAPERGAL